MMSDAIKPFAEWAAISIEATGICLIILMAVWALLSAFVRLVTQRREDEIYLQLRQRLGRGILLGLEFLVAADIIHTVAVELTFTTVGVLAIVVLIRTFLSFSLEVELTGRWPWNDAEKETKNQVL